MRVDVHHYEQALLDLVRQLIDQKAKKIVLFASLGRGHIRLDSDIDLLAVFDDNDCFKSRMRKLYDVIEADIDFDLLAYNEQELDRMKNRSLIRHILKECKFLYEAR